MATKSKTYYSWGNQTPKEFRKTPKQFRLIGDGGTATVIKPSRTFSNLNATLHTYTFPNGTTRQWFFAGARWSGLRGIDGGDLAHYERTMLDLATCEQDCEVPYALADIGFVTHPDDKVFHRDRIVYHHKGTRDYDGGVKHGVTYSGRFRICRAFRGLPDEYIPVHRTYVVCETWVKWGGLEVLLDDGLCRKTSYDIGDGAVRHVFPRKGKCLRLDEFRASQAPNPFDDPFEPELKAVRDKRNEMNEDIARAVFHPERVGRMMTAYGEDWDERV